MIDRNNSIPIYQQLVEIFLNRIKQGSWKKGEKIPSEAELIKQLNISRGTLRKAINELVDRNVLEKIQGKGTFVKNEKISYPLSEGLLSFAESLENQHLEYETKILEISFRKANKDISGKLKINEGDEYLYLKRLRSVEQEKVMVIENRLNLNLVPNLLEHNFLKESLFKAIEEESNMKITYSESKYAATYTTKERAMLLEIPERSPILHLEQMVYLENGKPIDYGNVWLKADKYYVRTVLMRDK
ncbi:GntR family transcriptional regulator [Aerococcus mictus]|uniref:GntR family transcriptional regulator n=1 Tax=Aerococcus mictus TaxID=2976810 RepID=UPI000DCE1B57|nr:GntR family transcriptional regulator [Aerococcus mictus]KAA9233751.1 GntR family transcriptional regulator [Aerococcus mictus]MDL5183862.1 GntR family transcriptional regulator [Aerococcus mictus]